MNRTTPQGLTIVDSHVHIHDCFDVAALLDSAHEHFRLEAQRHEDAGEFTGVLILAETSQQDWFGRLSSFADANETISGDRGNRWSFSPTNETCSLLGSSNDGRELVLIAGRQIVARENLEVLALATRSGFRDGAPVDELIMTINEHEALPVLPWGVGKWLGKRGAVVQSLLNRADRPLFLLGDNGGRPVFWSRPALFRMAERHGIRVLPGTDPLPLPAEELRCGRFGFAMKGLVSKEHPGAEIKNMINDSSTEISPYGKLEGPLQFIRNQLRLRQRRERPA